MRTAPPPRAPGGGSGYRAPPPRALRAAVTAMEGRAPRRAVHNLRSSRFYLSWVGEGQPGWCPSFGHVFYCPSFIALIEYNLLSADDSALSALCAPRQGRAFGCLPSLCHAALWMCDLQLLAGSFNPHFNLYSFFCRVRLWWVLTPQVEVCLCVLYRIFGC